MKKRLQSLRRIRAWIFVFGTITCLPIMALASRDNTQTSHLALIEQAALDYNLSQHDANLLRYLWFSTAAPILGSAMGSLENLVTQPAPDNITIAKALLEDIAEDIAARLTDEGFAAEASLLLSCNLQSCFSTLDLGSHAPLSEKLACVYDAIESRIGHDRARSMRLSDIKTMNYGLPVTFQPRGDRRAGQESHRWDKLEYRRHFVPVAEALTYWGAYLECRRSTEGQPVGRSLCKRLARLVSQVVELRVAPLLSDKIFEGTNNR